MILVGRAQWLKDNGVTEEFLQTVDLNETEGFSLIFVARDRKFLGWIGMQDQTRAEAREALAELKQSGVRRIAMVSGDRQPVAGDIGIAMGAAGSEVAIHSATIALMNNDLKRLPFLVKLSRQTRTVINQNFLFGVCFIIGGLTAAAFGYLNPIVAAILHNAGSLIVVFNSARLVRQGEELEPYQAQSTDSAKPGSTPAPTLQPA
jgi:Zn2+/Cd2+-exporting ATPase